MKNVNVSLPIGVDARQTRHHTGQTSEVIPIDNNACCFGNGNQMYGVVGGTARG